MSGRAPLGQREFGVIFHVSVSSDTTCENLSVGYSYRALFNGRPSQGESATESFDSGAPATGAAFDVRASGFPAETVAFSAQGTCEEADGTVLSTSNRVARNVRIPAHSCEQGPLRVLVLLGAARRSGVAVRRGHYLRVDDAVTLARRSRIAFGAADCGFRVSVSAGRTLSFRTGGYFRSAAGLATIVGVGATVDFRGDRHAGGIQTPSAIVLPRSAARVSIVASSPTVTTVRVRRGVVVVAPRIRRSTFGKRIVVRAPHGVRCAGGVCR